MSNIPVEDNDKRGEESGEKKELLKENEMRKKLKVCFVWTKTTSIKITERN